jgi:hypothetical protein
VAHVDIVKNEWLAGYQLVVARLSDENGQLRIDALDEWRSLVERYRSESGINDDMAFMESLHETLKGDYLFATEPHDEQACAFHAMRVQLQSVDVNAEHALASRRL